MDPKKMTVDDVFQVETELRNLLQKRKILTTFIVICAVLSGLFAFIAIELVLMGWSKNFNFLIFLICFNFLSMIILIILRAIIFNKAITSRRNILIDAKRYKELQTMYNSKK